MRDCKKDEGARIPSAKKLKTKVGYGMKEKVERENEKQEC